MPLHERLVRATEREQRDPEVNARGDEIGPELLRVFELGDRYAPAYRWMRDAAKAVPSPVFVEVVAMRPSSLVVPYARKADA